MSDSENHQTSKSRPSRHTGLRSSAWNHFKRLTKTNEQGKEVEDIAQCKCNYCGKVLACHPVRNGTSVLKRHVELCKKKPRVSSTSGKQSLLTTTYSSTGETTLLNWTYDQEKARRQLAMLILIAELPFKLVEHPQFRIFMREVQPQFNPISRHTCRRDIWSLFQEEKVKLKNYFKKSGQSVSITTDTWTSNRGTCFLSITAHFVNEDWRLVKRILNFVPISDHSGEGMGEVIRNCMWEWGIKKIVCCTVDNASANTNLVSYLTTSFSSISGGEHMHFRCVAHIINLFVKDGLDEHNDSIVRVREAVKFVKASSSRMQKFKQCVEMEGITAGNLLCQDVSTRWNSTYMMLDSAEKFEKAFSRFHAMEPHFNSRDIPGGLGLPYHDDWNVVRTFLHFLKHFYDLTNTVSASERVTIPTLFHHLCILYGTLERWKSLHNPQLFSMCEKMIGKCNKYWGAKSKLMNKLVFVVVCLDPRYKLSYVQEAVKLFYPNEEDGKSKAEEVRQVLFSIFDEYNKLNSSTSTHDDGFGSGSQVCTTISVNSQSFNSSIQDDAWASYKKIKTVTGESAKLSDLDKYLREACESDADGIDWDILGWWKAQNFRLPILSLMARDIFGIPITTVPSESVFSTGGRVLNDFRSSLTPKIAEALICAQNWFRNSADDLIIQFLEEELEDQLVFESEVSNIEGT